MAGKPWLRHFSCVGATILSSLFKSLRLITRERLVWKTVSLVLSCGAAILCLAFIIFPLPASAQQACVPPPQGILAWWPFDETAGPTAAELIAGRVGTYFGSPTPAPGEVNNALKFHGSPDFVGVADDDVWAFGLNDFSIELWANFSTPGGGSIGHPSHIFI